MSLDAQSFPTEADHIGQLEAMTLIEQAIKASPYAPESKVYHILGRGGIGKSHLLREAHKLALADRQAAAIPRLETGIIDLAHTGYQHPLLLMSTITRRLSRSLSDHADAATLFADFDRQAKFYLVAQGAESRNQEGLAQVRAAFLYDYNQLAQHYPIVLTIDTFERLDPSMPEVESYNFRPLSRLETWLLDLISALDNSLTFIASRIRPRQGRFLAERLGARLVRRLALRPFSPAETREYMERQGHRDYDLAWYTRMHEVSGGHPVQLIVALEIARAANFDVDRLPSSFQEPDPSNLQQLGEDFFTTFISSLYDNEPTMARLIEQATYLRKGLDPKLLKHLAHAEGDTHTTIAQIDATLKRLRSMAFVKVSGDQVASLHDDIYDILLDRINPTSADRWYEHTISYLDEQIETVSAEIERDRLTVERLARLRTAQIDRLYYRLARTPTLPGYQDYCELAYSTVLGNDEEFDAQLQEELARFFNPATIQGVSYRIQLQLHDLPWARVVFDEAVRWVFRRIHSYAAEGDQNQQALDLAARVQHDYAALIEQDTLAHASLEVARLEAEGLLARHHEQIEGLRRRYERLSSALRERTRLPLEREHPIEHHFQRQSRLLLAYALNNWGYLERVQQRLKTAAARYREAISLYKTLGRETTSLRATTLNNLAFALAEQGELDLGLLYAQRAATLLHIEGHRYREAVVHTTMARINLELDNVIAAEQAIVRARALLSEFPQTRHEAICSRGEGELRRWIGFRNRTNPTLSEEQYVRALACYEEALRFFKPNQAEPVRLAEIYQGIGCTYRNRGYTRILRREAGTADMEAARVAYATALEYCPEQLPLRAAILEDIAVSYVHEENYAEATILLHHAEQQIPPDYTVEPLPGTTAANPTDEIQQFWLQRAQIDLQLALCAFGLNQLQEACDRLLRAFAALYRFSPRAQQLGTFRTIARTRIADLRNPAQIKDLRRTTYLRSQRLQAREAFLELNRLFSEAEEIAALL